MHFGNTIEKSCQGDNLDPNKDREEVYGKPWKWEGFGTPTRINHAGNRSKPQTSWAQILEERAAEEAKKERELQKKIEKENPKPKVPKKNRGKSVHGYNSADGSYHFWEDSTDLYAELGFRSNGVTDAIRQGRVFHGWVFWRGTGMTKAVIMDRLRRSTSPLSGNPITTRKIHAYNFWTGEKVTGQTYKELAIALNCPKSNVEWAASKGNILLKRYLVWTDLNPFTDEELEYQSKTAKARLKNPPK